ncbi:MAG: UDP-N-acetylmuramoyl-tripeptide--D-alanyl-D-alanine ligase [Gammaproteobacteria bacterium]|nr:UDP-N-acetylmuramoyl-tripeptide--D-alanyl-D-alanine ligase [Gammaproteobacteria bacterium]
MAWHLSEIAAAADGRLVGADITIDRISTDTRNLKGGELFVALTGERFDGHTFAEQAIAGGARALLVDHRLAVAIPQIVVADTRRALGRIAAAWRSHFSLPVIAVTGSNGKTTVKEMIASILECAGGPVLVTRGNLNNDIGMPLTLLRLNDSHRFAVIEMGANHQGEIDYLTHLVQPHVALINNAAPAHLAGFGSIEGVARAKGEIYCGLDQQGIAIINADDRFAPLWRELTQHRQRVEFAIDNVADFTADNLGGREDGRMSFVLLAQGERRPVSLPLLGRHNVMNALAAAAAASAAGATLDDIVRGLEQMRPVAGRLQRRDGIHGAQLIDDTYNANPASMTAALEVLRQYSGVRIYVMGDMGELGDDAAQLHVELGRRVLQAGIDRLFTVGPLAAAAATAFGQGAHSFAGHQELITELQHYLATLHGAVTVLVKGSRSMHMEQVVAALAVDGGADGAGHGLNQHPIQERH